MADYKDYIVRYDIQADVTKAAEGHSINSKYS